MRLIRENFQDKKLTTAIAIYQSLTELASNTSNDTFNAYNSQIAKLCGKSASIVKSYCKRFIDLGILDKKQRKVDEKTNLSNEWRLLTPSVNNNYHTSDKDNETILVEYDEPQLEEINNKERCTNYRESVRTQ